MSKDYYNILGVDRNATDEQIKAAFRKKSRETHPDLHPGDKEKENQFKEINEAYSVLSDKQKRSNYDNFGSADNQGNFSGMDDFFNSHADMFSGFGDFGFNFGGFGRNSRKKPKPTSNEPENGDDFRTDIHISFKEAVFGCTKEIRLSGDKPCHLCHGTGLADGAHYDECPDCHGTGTIVHTVRQGFMTQQTISACGKCHGTGYIGTKCSSCNGSKREAYNKIISVKIPAGISDGMKLRVAGAGECGVCGGNNGDLYINVIVDKSDIFERRGNDIFTKATISPFMAILGGKIEVPTVNGIKTVKFPAGVKDKINVRIPNEGIKTSNGTGDHYVELNIANNMKFDSTQLDMLKKLNESFNFNKFTDNITLKDKAQKFYS